MLRGSYNYFSFFGVMLSSVNVTLSASLTKFENILETTFIMIEAFLRERLLSPLLIQQKIKIKK